MHGLLLRRTGELTDPVPIIPCPIHTYLDAP